jgi:phosphatidylserine/phosphatidylglycerophosphate/cardiolipin synthase-like enzyme
LNEIEFTITAPDQTAPLIAYENRVRLTHGVLIDIIVLANEYIVFSSPYLKDFGSSNIYIHTAILAALKRGVKLHIITTESSLQVANIDQYKEFQVYIYTPNGNHSDGIVQSHSKFCLSDGKQVYLGSANFTFLGLNKNFEMGVYSKGTLAKQVESFWFYLLDNKYLVPRNP